MIFSILPNTISTLLLSTSLITTLTFKDDVRSFIYGGVKEEFFSELTNSNRTLVLKARKKEIDSNLIIVTSKNRYYFHVKNTETNPHQFIEVEDATINSNFKKIKESKEYDLFLGMTSLMVVNKLKTPIIVNGVVVTAKEFFSKGVPLFINGTQVLY